jgi:hypothetical protein
VELSAEAVFPHPRGINARETAAVLAPLVGIDDPGDIGAYLIVVIDTTGLLRSTGTDNIPPPAIPAFLEWAARNFREALREAN